MPEYGLTKQYLGATGGRLYLAGRNHDAPFACLVSPPDTDLSVYTLIVMTASIGKRSGRVAFEFQVPASHALSVEVELVDFFFPFPGLVYRERGLSSIYEPADVL